MVLAACAAPTPQYWYKQGATEAEFNRTMARCRMQAASIAPAAPTPTYPGTAADLAVQQAGRDLSEAGTYVQFIDDCLVASGWHR